MGGKEETDSKTKTMFKKTAWSLISVGVKKTAPGRNRGIINRRMSTAGFRALQQRASRLSLGAERYAKQSAKLHKNQKIRTQRKKIKVDHMDMGTLHEDAEMEEISEAIEHSHRPSVADARETIGKVMSNTEQTSQHTRQNSQGSKSQGSKDTLHCRE